MERYTGDTVDRCSPHPRHAAGKLSWSRVVEGPYREGIRMARHAGNGSLIGYWLADPEEERWVLQQEALLEILEALKNPR